MVSVFSPMPASAIYRRAWSFFLARTRPANPPAWNLYEPCFLAIRTGRWPKDLASLSMAVVRAEILFCASMARDPCRMKSGFHAGPEKAAAFFRFMRRTAPPSIPTSFIASWLASRKMFTGPYMVSALPNLKISPASMRRAYETPFTAPVLGQA